MPDPSISKNRAGDFIPAEGPREMRWFECAACPGGIELEADTESYGLPVQCANCEDRLNQDEGYWSDLDLFDSVGHRRNEGAR